MRNGGRLIGIARRAAPRAPMATLEAARIATASGVEGDSRGVARPGKPAKHEVTLLAREAWLAVCAERDREIPWTSRRANLFGEGGRRDLDRGGIA